MMTLHTNPLAAVLLVLLIIAVGVWIIRAIVDERKLQIIACVAWVLLAVLAAFGLLR